MIRTPAAGRSRQPTRPIIVACAIAGSIHTPSMSPRLPVTPEAIAKPALGASGGSILDLHARDPAAKGRLDRSNAEQVEQVGARVAAFGRAVAAPAQARGMLAPKGAGQAAT